MSRGIEIKNLVLLEYPTDYLPVVINPSSKGYLLFPDSVDILCEKLGYELYYLIQENPNVGNNIILIYKSHFDSSFLDIRVKLFFVPIGYNSYVPLFEVEECCLIDDFYREDITKGIEHLIKVYPKKIDLFSLLGLDFIDENNFLFPRCTTKNYFNIYRRSNIFF